jgi:DNA-directed RNA polymerase beta' subunit
MPPHEIVNNSELQVYERTLYKASSPPASRAAAQGAAQQQERGPTGAHRGAARPPPITPAQMPERRPQPNGVLDPRLGVSNKRATCETCHQGLADCPGHFGGRCLPPPQALPPALLAGLWGLRSPRPAHLRTPRRRGGLAWLPTTDRRPPRPAPPAGYIPLALPVFHIGYFKSTVQVLQCICKSCARLLLPEAERAAFARRLRSTRLERVAREATFRRMLDRCKRARVCPRCGDDNGVVKKAPGSLKVVHDPYVKNAELRMA